MSGPLPTTRLDAGPSGWPAPLRRWAKLLLRLRLTQLLGVSVLSVALPGGGALSALLLIIAALSVILTRQSLRGTPGRVTLTALCLPPLCSGLFSWLSAAPVTTWKAPAYSLVWLGFEAALLLASVLTAAVATRWKIGKPQTAAHHATGPR